MANKNYEVYIWPYLKLIIIKQNKLIGIKISWRQINCPFINYLNFDVGMYLLELVNCSLSTMTILIKYH
jgi:hypothetical protein